MNIRRALFSSLMAATLALTAVGTASAHARYKTSMPGKGEVLAASPARVAIVFTQEIQKVTGSYTISVARDRGASVVAGQAQIDESDRHNLSIGLMPDLAAGRYVVNWTNTADDDGDPAEGAFAFYIKSPPTPVDLANDAQLEQVGFEGETPGASGTAAPGASAAATSAAATRPAATRAAVTAVASPTPASASSSGGSSNTTTVVIVVIAAIIGVAVGFGGWRVIASRR